MYTYVYVYVVHEQPSCMLLPAAGPRAGADRLHRHHVLGRGSALGDVGNGGFPGSLEECTLGCCGVAGCGGDK